MATIIGRKQESEELLNIYHRKQSQLVAVYSGIFQRVVTLDSLFEP